MGGDQNYIKVPKMRETSATPYPMSSIEAGMESNGASFLRDEDSFYAHLVNICISIFVCTVVEDLITWI